MPAALPWGTDFSCEGKPRSGNAIRATEMGKNLPHTLAVDWERTAPRVNEGVHGGKSGRDASLPI